MKKIRKRNARKFTVYLLLCTIIFMHVSSIFPHTYLHAVPNKPIVDQQQQEDVVIEDETIVTQETVENEQELNEIKSSKNDEEKSDDTLQDPTEEQMKEEVTEESDNEIEETKEENIQEIPTIDEESLEVTEQREEEKTDTVEEEAPVEVLNDFNSFPHLLITEISPNSKGGGTDYYEYFELYNNTTQQLHLNHYSFYYNYTDSDKEIAFQLPAVVMDSKESLVIWYNANDKTLEEFNNNFDTNLSSEQIVELKDSNFPGFANGGNRGIIVRNQLNEQVISAEYASGESDNNGAVIEFKYPQSETTMEKWHTLVEPTPGIINIEQVPNQPVEVPEIVEDTESPIIEHTPVTEVDAFNPITIEAIIKDNIAIPSATLYIKTEEEETYRSYVMSGDNHTYTVDVPGEYIHANISYFIEATDGLNTSKTDSFEVEVQKEEVDYDKVPELLVTELVPDSTNVGSADGYEFIEIYNNTDKPVNFKDYQMQYRYGTDPESDIVWPAVPNDVIIQPKQTLVFWVINGQNDQKTVADFNAIYGSNLVEGKDIVRIYTAGMANSGVRGLIVATNAGRELSIAYYNEVEGIDDTHKDKGIVYKFPVDGSNIMSKLSAGTTNATPGTVEVFQVPSQTVTKEEDTKAPVIQNVTEATEIVQTSDIHLEAIVEDETEVKTVEVFYRTNSQEEYQSKLLEQDYNDRMYHHLIYSPEIIAKEYVEYYFVASDGTNETKSETYRVKIINTLDTSSLRMNVKNGDMISGEYVLKGTSAQDEYNQVDLFIDNELVEEATYQAIEHTAYLAFEVSGVNTYFQNGVTIGDEVIHIFDDWIAQWETITVPVSPNQLMIGDNIMTIRAGNKASPWEGDEGENRDDYNLRNVRLVLSDGTIIRDSQKDNPETVYDMGDDGTDRILENFTFSISNEMASSKAFVWNTTAVPDGEHTITVTDQDETIEAEILVDNTAPVITSSIKDGDEFKGNFTITSDIKDAIAGVKESSVWLDGKEIEVPYSTSSGALESGTHELTIVAEDNIGNKNREVIQFIIVEENPNMPVNTSPNHSVGDPVLRVEVSDPMSDDVDVTFYEGYQYTTNNRENMKAYSNATDMEPPNVQIPADENIFEAKSIDLTSELDGEYFITDSSTQFPYHRFEVTVNPEVDVEDRVELIWKGNSFQGRKVTMYAWNVQTSKWEAIDDYIAGEDDFELKGYVKVSDFVVDNKINVIIQDEIPASKEEYDYTFVWMSDTQYYSESYPHIYDQQTKWIVDNQENMNIEYVIHTGDLVDEADQEYQWINADNYMKTLDDNNIPYGVLAGNHDVSQKTNDYTAYYNYFGANRFENRPYYGGSYLNNRGHYDLISINGNDFIMVYLGWGIDEEGIAWMNDVLKAHPNRIAILNFHEYLQATGTRHPIGEKLYEEVVVPNKNVVAVLSGHYHESQTLIDEIDDDGDGITDRQVYQMLADYQAGPEGGQGYMRLLHFDQDNNRVMVNTYSPYLDDYNYYDNDLYPGKDEFVIDLDLTLKEKRVATDYFAVNIFTDNKIGQVENVRSGETAEVTWTGLVEGQTYSWYTTVTDKHTGSTTSDIWTFVKGEDDQISNPPIEEEEEDPEVPTNPPKPTEPILPNQPSTNEGVTDNGGDSESTTTNPSQVTNDNEEDRDSSTEEMNQDNNQIKLPHTTTTMYTIMLIGFILMCGGMTWLALQKKQKIQ